MKKKIEITKCLFPSKDGNWTGVEQPKIEGMQCITTSVVEIDGKHYEQFEFIPDNLDLCCGGNAKREGNFIHLLDESDDRKSVCDVCNGDGIDDSNFYNPPCGRCKGTGKQTV